MELCMAALLATAFAYRNIISLVCVGFVAIGMAAAPPICAQLWRVLVRTDLQAHRVDLEGQSQILTMWRVPVLNSDAANTSRQSHAKGAVCCS